MGQLIDTDSEEFKKLVAKEVAAQLKKDRASKTFELTDKDLPFMDDPKLKKFADDSFAALEKLTGVGQEAIAGLDAFGRFGRAKYDIIQEQLGGIGDIANVSNETSKAALQELDETFALHLGNTVATGDLMVQRNGEQMNMIAMAFETPAKAAQANFDVRDKLAMRQTLRINEMTKQERAHLGSMTKALNISADKVAALAERQISTTGKASLDIFKEVGAFAKSVSEATGAPFHEISGQITNIITDVNRFGNVQVDEAARIAGALQQLGLSYQGFGGMVDRFMNFDQAAESLGNLTTVFGVHFDAMEMMQLANEDQEEFLYRMREAFLDSGKAVEDMTLAEKRLASQQMGMSIQDFENFMQEDREIGDLDSATADAKVEEGMQALGENMKQVNLTAAQLKQNMITKVLDPISKEAYQTGEDFATMKKKAMMNPEQYVPSYQKFAEYARGTIRAALGTGGFGGDEGLKSDLIKLQTGINQGDIDVKDTAKILEEIKKLELKKNVTLKDMLELSMDAAGGTGLITAIAEILKDRSKEGIDTMTVVLDDMKKQIEAGEKLDQEEILNRTRAVYTQEADLIAAGLKESGQAALNKSFLAIIAPLSEDQKALYNEAMQTIYKANPEAVIKASEEELQKMLDEQVRQKQNVEANLKSESEDVVLLAETLNNEASKNEQVRSDENKALGAGIANVGKAVVDQANATTQMLAGLQIMNVIEIDGVAVGKQLSKVDMGGVTFTVNSQVDELGVV